VLRSPDHLRFNKINPVLCLVAFAFLRIELEFHERFRIGFSGLARVILLRTRHGEQVLDATAPLSLSRKSLSSIPGFLIRYFFCDSALLASLRTGAAFIVER
jgi:hypothetical protein